jgi:predicted Zn-dependent peptidase
LERAKTYLKARRRQGHQRLKERAFAVGWAESMGLGADFHAKFEALVDAVSLDDVNRLARRVFGGPFAAVYSLPPAPPLAPIGGAEATERKEAPPP